MTTTLSDLLGAEAAAVEFEHDGETYKVTPVTLQVESRIERYLRKRAYDRLYADRDVMPADQYEDALAVLLARRADYAFMGTAFWKTLADRGGMAGLVAILLSTTEAKASKLIAERGPDVSALVTETILSSLPREQAEAARLRFRERGAAGEVPAPANPPAPAG